MFNLQEFENNLVVTHVLSKAFGIMVYAKHPSWVSEYHFFIDPGGKVIGKTSGGRWMEVSSELKSVIVAKVKSLLIKPDGHIYS